jgi:nitroreductase
MDTIAAIHGRRSIRNYEPRPVPRPLLEAILHDTAQAPTPPVSGTAPFVFLVIEGLERIAGYGAAALAFAKEHRKPGLAYDWVEKPGFVVFFNAPVVVGRHARPAAVNVSVPTLPAIGEARRPSTEVDLDGGSSGCRLLVLALRMPGRKI